MSSIEGAGERVDIPVVNDHVGAPPEPPELHADHNLNPLPNDEHVGHQLAERGQGAAPKEGILKTLFGAVMQNKVRTIGILVTAVGLGCCLCAAAAAAPLMVVVLASLVFSGGLVLWMAAPFLENYLDELIGCIMSSPADEMPRDFRHQEIDEEPEQEIPDRVNGEETGNLNLEELQRLDPAEFDPAPEPPANPHLGPIADHAADVLHEAVENLLHPGNPGEEVH